MKNTKEHGAVGIKLVIGLAIVVVIGAIGFYVYSQRDSSVETSQDSVIGVDDIDGDIEKNKTYNSTFQNASFDYPSSWAIEVQDAFEGGEPKIVNLVSPGGLKITYFDQVDGLGSGPCEDDSPRVVITGVNEVPGLDGLYLAEDSNLTLALTDSITEPGSLGTCTAFGYFTSKMHDDTRIGFGTNVLQFSGADTEPLSDTEKADLDEARVILNSFRY